jgi:hypothetical protein
MNYVVLIMLVLKFSLWFLLILGFLMYLNNLQYWHINIVFCCDFHRTYLLQWDFYVIMVIKSLIVISFTVNPGKNKNTYIWEKKWSQELSKLIDMTCTSMKYKNLNFWRKITNKLILRYSPQISIWSSD